MGEFKRAVQGNARLQHLLFDSNKPDVKLLKSVFRQMHDVHPDSANVSKADFMEYWEGVDADHSGKVTKDEFDASQKKRK